MWRTKHLWCYETTDVPSFIALNTRTCLHLIHLGLDQMVLNMNRWQAFETRHCGFQQTSCGATQRHSPSPCLMFSWHHWASSMSCLSLHLQPNTDSACRESPQSILCPDLTHGAALSAMACKFKQHDPAVLDSPPLSLCKLSTSVTHVPRKSQATPAGCLILSQGQA